MPMNVAATSRSGVETEDRLGSTLEWDSQATFGKDPRALLECYQKPKEKKHEIEVIPAEAQRWLASKTKGKQVLRLRHSSVTLFTLRSVQDTKKFLS